MAGRIFVFRVNEQDGIVEAGAARIQRKLVRVKIRERDQLWAREASILNQQGNRFLSARRAARESLESNFTFCAASRRASLKMGLSF